MRHRQQQLGVLASLLVLLVPHIAAQNGARLCTLGGRCLGDITTACTCTSNSDSAFCGDACRSTWGGADALDCLQLAGNDGAVQALTTLTQRCNARAAGGNASELTASYQSDVEAQLGCLSDVPYDSVAAQQCLSGASNASCPAACSNLLGSIPASCRTSTEASPLLGGQFSLLFSGCNVSATSDAAAASTGSGTSSVNAAPPPPPDGRMTMNTQHAAPRAALSIGLWLQVALGAMLLCLGAAW